MLYYTEEERTRALKMLSEREEEEEEEEEEEDEEEVEVEKEEKKEPEANPDGSPVEESDDEEQFSEWFNEEMKKHGFNEGLFDGVKAFIGKVDDTLAGVSRGVDAAQAGKKAGDVLSIAGTTMNANKFKRAYKELWLGFNKGLKIMNPKLQEQIANNEDVRNSVNQILGNIIDGLEAGKIRKLADASQKVLPGTNPEQAEAKKQQSSGGDAPVKA